MQRRLQVPSLRDALISSEAVENLRRVWETVSLNVLDGPAAPNTAPTAWADLLADAVIGHGLDDSILARLRPRGSHDADRSARGARRAEQPSGLARFLGQVVRALPMSLTAGRHILAMPTTSSTCCSASRVSIN